MNIMLLLAHPDSGSFNHAIAGVCRQTLQELGHMVWYHDLYAEGFEPLLPAAEFPREAQLDQPLEQHCIELASADGIVVVHPNWWGQPPAIMKGWIDRVIRPGVAYRFDEGDSGEGLPVGLLKARAAVLFNTGNTPQKREQDVFGDPLDNLWRKCIFGLCGVTEMKRLLFTVVVTSSYDERQRWLRQASELVAETFPRDM